MDPPCDLETSSYFNILLFDIFMVLITVTMICVLGSYV